MLVSCKPWLILAWTISAVRASDSTRCYTFYGTGAQYSLPTSWHTHYTPCTSTRTVTSIVSTYLPGATVTTTVTYTSTLSTGTYTVPTSSGFVPVQSTYPSRTPYDGAFDDPSSSKRGLKHDLAGRDAQLASDMSFSNSSLHQFIPQSVGCNLWTKGRCTTKTRIVTSTAVLSATAIPVTVTRSTNATTTLTTATVFAACANSDLAYAPQVTKIAGPTNSYAVLYAAPNPYECCVAAFSLNALGTASGIATLFGYDVGSDGLAGACYIAYLPNTTTCSAGQAQNKYDVVEGQSTLYVTGNGPCGEIVGSEVLA